MEEQAEVEEQAEEGEEDEEPEEKKDERQAADLQRKASAKESVPRVLDYTKDRPYKAVKEMTHT